MSPEQIGFALLYLGIFLLIGKWIRMRVKWMQKLFLPASVIGGFFALLLGPEVAGTYIGKLHWRRLILGNRDFVAGSCGGMVRTAGSDD